MTADGYQISADGYQTSNIIFIDLAIPLENSSADDNTSMNPYREKKNIIIKPKQTRSWKKFLLSWLKCIFYMAKE